MSNTNRIKVGRYGGTTIHVIAQRDIEPISMDKGWWINANQRCIAVELTTDTRVDRIDISDLVVQTQQPVE